MSAGSRLQALQGLHLLHPRAEAVTAPLFVTHPGFFLASDKVQVKYEMLRAHVVDGQTITAAAAAHAYSRAEFYLVAAAFEDKGMTGLLDERRGRKGPVKLTPEVLALLERLGRGGHRVRARGAPAPQEHPAGPAEMSRFWPAAESAQADYERLRAAVLATGALPAEVAAARFGRRGVAGLIAWPAAEPVFAAGLRGAARPAWSPYADPRLDALAAAYRLLLAPGADGRHALARAAVEQSRA